MNSERILNVRAVNDARKRANATVKHCQDHVQELLSLGYIDQSTYDMVMLQVRDEAYTELILELDNLFSD
jgi:hypothetical protein